MGGEWRREWGLEMLARAIGRKMGCGQDARGLSRTGEDAQGCEGGRLVISWLRRSCAQQQYRLLRLVECGWVIWACLHDAAGG